MRAVLSLLFFVCVSNFCDAEIVLAVATPVDNSSGGADLSDYVTQDIVIDFNGNYTGSQLLVTLTGGTGPRIYQHPHVVAGAISPPSAAAVSSSPAAEFDTFAANGSLLSGGPFGNPGPVGGAIDLGGSATGQFDMSGINYTWFDPAPQASNETSFVVARLSLRDDVEGQIAFQASADGMIQSYTGSIMDGVVGPLTAVPEPSAFAFLAVAVLGVYGWQRIPGAWLSRFGCR